MLRVGGLLRKAATTRRPLLPLTNSGTHPAFTTATTVLHKEAPEGSVTPVGVPYSKITVGIPKETFPLEKRVAATPESVARLVKPGFNVQIEKGAGSASYFADEVYEEAGAKVVDDIWETSDIVLKVRFLLDLTRLFCSVRVSFTHFFVFLS